jgi:transcriptional regulator of acetoin/glycerol metabolism
MRKKLTIASVVRLVEMIAMPIVLTSHAHADSLADAIAKCAKGTGKREIDTNAEPGYLGIPGEPLSCRAAKDKTLLSFNRSDLGRLLGLHKGNVTQAAKSCGLERQALQQIVRRCAISADDFRK